MDEIDERTNFGFAATVAGKQDSLETHGNLSTPAPMLGLYADWRFIPRFYLRADVQYLSVTVSGIGATISDDKFAVEWYAFENYGFGINYHYVGADLTKQLRTGSELRLKYTIRGPSIYATAAW